MKCLEWGAEDRGLCDSTESERERRDGPSMGCVYICIYSTECKNLFDISHLINIKSSRLRKDVEK